jgi:hypothetical protein
MFLAAYLLLLYLICDARAHSAATSGMQGRDNRSRDSNIPQNFFIDEKKIRQRLKSREDAARALKSSARSTDQRSRRQSGQPKNDFSPGVQDDGPRMWPKVNLICDPLINFKIKQRFSMLGASVTLGTLF